MRREPRSPRPDSIPEPLPASFYDRSVVTVARELIGCVLVSHTGPDPVAGRIVETEAYRHDDAASHAFGGPSVRNAPMFGPPGHAYVYLIYGMYDCFNVVCGPEEKGDAVLIRAVEPIIGLAPLWHNRYGESLPKALAQMEGYAAGTGSTSGAGRRSTSDAPTERGPASAARLRARLRNLTSGPGKLCRAFAITRETVNGASLQTGPVTVHPGAVAGPVTASRRIGISKAVGLEWRFVEEGNPFVSRRT